MVKLDDQYIALIAYASAYGFLVVLIGIYVHFSRKKNKRKQRQQRQQADDDKSYIQEVWHAREIYAAVVVHLYDQATDIAIMVQWAGFLQLELSGERDLESVDMLTFFVPGIMFIIIYRVITMIFAIYEDTKTEQEHVVYRDIDKQKEHQRSKKSIWIVIWDLILSAFDLYFVKIVYLEFEKGEARPNAIHRSLQLCEALFESMPQVVLQSVFLLRYSASQGGADDTWAITLIIISITASILSIANKYSWFDRQAVVWNAKALNGGIKNKCHISWKFLLRQLWRWSDLFTRFVILTLIWTCIGGIFLVIYLCLCVLFYYFVALDRIKMSPLYRLLATAICIVGIILDYEWHFCILRLIDNGIMMIVVSVFVFVVDSDRTDGSNSSIIFAFTLIGLIAYGVELITYPILQLRTLHIIKKALQGRQFFSIILFGDDSEIPSFYLTYFIDSDDKEDGNRGLSVVDIEYFTGKTSSEDCEKLGEDLEKAIRELINGNKSLNINMNTGDIAIDYKTSKVFKYGISLRCLQNVVYQTGNKAADFGEEAKECIKNLYSKEETMSVVRNVFDKHFKRRDGSKKWSLTFDTEESIFIVVNAESANKQKGTRHPVVAKYRFGEEFKKYNKDVRIINGHDYDAGLHVKDKQVAIKVLDYDKSNKIESKKNEDIFIRERSNLERLNAENEHKLNILPYIGWDDAADAYFLVTKRLFGPKIVDKVSKNNGIQCVELMKYIRQMFEIIAYVHDKDISMRNISDNSFQFADEKEGDSEMYLVHYENSKHIDNETMYGNISKQKVLYLSPELCKVVKLRYKNKRWQQDISGKMYRASDVWALGILTFYLLRGRHPFFRSGATPNKLKKTLNKIMNHEEFEYLEAFKYDELNKSFTDFMNKVLCSDYNARYSCAQCLEHEFLSSQFIDKFEKNEHIKPEIVQVLKGNVIQTKLHESIARVRAEQIEKNEEKLQHRQSVKIEQNTDNMDVTKTDTEIEKLFDMKAEEGMKEQFKRIDLDGDGYTTVDELTKLLTSLGYALNFAQKEAKYIMNELDQDGDGTIDFNEFAQAWVSRKLTISDKYAHAIFNVFDENGDGFISIEELKHALYKEDDDDGGDNKEDDSDSDDDDGYLANFFKSLEEERKNEQLQEILNEVDDNKDGKISFEEFHKAMVGDMKDNEDAVPFTNIVNAISFKEINENGRDPLFEHDEEYLTIDKNSHDNEDDDGVDAVAMTKKRAPSTSQ